MRCLLLRVLVIGWVGVGLLWADSVRAEETVCLQCHGSQQGRLGEPVGLWRGSVHAANGISCHDCHGGDPTDFASAMSPEKGFLGVPEKTAIPDFCGRCHVGVREDYLASHHGQALGHGGPQCVTCHGNHAVVKASLELINEKDCTRCHEFGRAKTIKAAVAETDSLLSGLSGDLRSLHRVGITVDKLEGQTFALRNDFHRLFHSVDVDLVRQQTAKFQARTAEIRNEIDQIQDRLHQRKLWGGLAAGLLLFAAALCALLRKTYHEEEGHG